MQNHVSQSVDRQLRNQEQRLEELSQWLNSQKDQPDASRLDFLESMFLEFLSDYYQERREMNQDIKDVSNQINQMTGALKIIAWVISAGIPTIIALLAYFGL